MPSDQDHISSRLILYAAWFDFLIQARAARAVHYCPLESRSARHIELILAPLQLSVELNVTPSDASFQAWHSEAHRHCTMSSHRPVLVATLGYRFCYSYDIGRGVLRAANGEFSSVSV